MRSKRKWSEAEPIPGASGDYHKRTHNHKLGNDVFEHYPSNRKIADPDVLDFVDALIQAGGKPKKDLKYLKETTAKRRGSGSVEDRLEDVLRKLCANRDYTASSFVDDSKKTQTITFKLLKLGFAKLFLGW
ncbi:hypothetical protein GQ600_20685 [Phytophthora cactorum]|nr:hypothetical protein GQ600_20685 [Phytophthora cactorum]